MKKIFLTIIPIFILLFSLGVWLIVSESYLSRKIQNLVPQNVKDVLGVTFFAGPKLKKEINFLRSELELVNSKLDKVSYQLRLKDNPSENIQNYISDKGSISFKVKNYFLPYDINDNFYRDKTKGVKPFTSYIKKNGENIFIIFQSGKILYFKENDLNTDKLNFKEIRNNLRKEFVKGTEQFVGIKGALIKDNHFYVTYTDIIKDTCYRTSIARADLSYKELKFESFLELDECIERAGKLYSVEFGMWSQGGRMLDWGSDKILFTTGNYSDLTVSQNLDSPFGKILEVNTKNGEYSVYSYGHRNPQGLLYLDAKNVLLETEHGTAGGDEINKITKGVNYGYPISSYGNSTRKGFKYKKHAEHGFQEPIKYFKTSHPPTEIVEVPKSLINKDNYFFFNTLAALKIVLVKIDKNFEKTEYLDEVYMDERIRDMMYLPNLNKFLIVQELSSNLGLLTITDSNLN